MDFFYKPPLQRNDECTSLENNYMNCLMQKALNDNVQTNRCNMSSLLWFNLECPRWINQFDDPVGFKHKFKKFFDEQYFQRMTSVRNLPKYKQPIVQRSVPSDDVLTNLHAEDVKPHPVFDKFYKENEETLKPEEYDGSQFTPETEVHDDHDYTVYTNFQERKENEPEVATHEYWQQYINDYRDKYSQDIENRQRYLNGETEPAAEVILHCDVLSLNTN